MNSAPANLVLKSHGDIALLITAEKTPSTTHINVAITCGVI